MSWLLPGNDSVCLTWMTNVSQAYNCCSAEALFNADQLHSAAC